MSILHRKLLHILTTTITTRLTSINHTPVLSKSVRYSTQWSGTGKGTSVDSMRQTWSQQFRECDIPDPESSADLIIAHVLGKKMVSLSAD